MTTTSQESGWTYCAALAMLLVAPLCGFLIANQYPILSTEVAILVAACLAAGALLGLTVGVGARSVGVIVLGMAIAFAVDMMYNLGASRPRLALLAAVCVALAWILRRHVALVTLVASTVLVASALLIPAKPAASPALPVRGDNGGTPIATGKLPVVLHLILDEHIGIDGLPQELEESADLARSLTEFYVSRGFRVYTRAYSEYFDTHNSIPNLLNFTSSTVDRHHLVAKKSRPFVLESSAYFQNLSNLGYRLHVYQSDYMDFCSVRLVSYSSCVTYSVHNIGAVAKTSLAPVERAEFVFGAFITGSNYLNQVRRAYGRVREWGLSHHYALPEWKRSNKRVGPLPVLPIVEQLTRDLRAATPGNAYFAHLLVPHYPYVLDESCHVRGETDDWLHNTVDGALDDNEQNTAASRMDRYRRYFAQIRCQQTLLDGVFDAMKQAGVWQDATVVIHGDHGSRIVRHLPLARNKARLVPHDFRDAFSTLFAVRIAGGEGVARPELRSLQQLLSESFNVPYQALAPRVYLGTEAGKDLEVYEPNGL